MLPDTGNLKFINYYFWTFKHDVRASFFRMRLNKPKKKNLNQKIEYVIATGINEFINGESRDLC